MGYRIMIKSSRATAMQTSHPAIFLLALSLGLAGPTLSATAQAPPCANEFMPLRAAVEKDGLAVKAAIERKAERSEVCNALKRFVTTETKYMKFLEDNQSWCGIPPDAIQQVKTGHGNSLRLRNQACAAAPAAARPGPPPGPGLSDALGTSRGTTPNNIKKGAGTFDTLTGSPFGQ
jgi:hypothetical protein